MAHAPGLSALTAIALVIALIYRFLIYPFFLSPLAKIPNAHPTSPLSPLWILWTRYQCRENRTVNAAHEKYGPIVRLAPNEISVNSVEGGIRTVYSGGYDKHEWYSNLFDNYGVPNMFSTIHSKPHSARKRMISNIYAKSQLQSSPQLAAISRTIIYDRLLAKVQEAADASQPLDALDLHYAVTMDFVTAYLFGRGIGSNFVQDDAKRNHWMALYHSRKAHTFFPQELPRLTAWLAAVGIRLVPTWVDDANRQIEDWCLEMCDASERLLSTSDFSTEKDIADKPVVYGQLKSAMEKQREKSNGDFVFYAGSMVHPKLHVIQSSGKSPKSHSVEAPLGFHAAGHETSGVTLTYLVWELSRRPETQAALRAELLTLSPPILYKSEIPRSSASLPPSKEIDALPLLHAVLMETLRLHAAIPGGQPRITPPNATLGPYSNIPAGVRVNAQAYSLHRNEDAFPCAQEWRPERWMIDTLDTDEEQLLREKGGEKKERWFWAFGSGGRMCVGSNLAIQEMKLIVASIYSNFTTTISDDSGIEQADAYTAGPVGGKLMIKYERQKVFFYLNHPIKNVCLVGVIIALEAYELRTIITLDDSSGMTIDMICPTIAPRNIASTAHDSTTNATGPARHAAGAIDRVKETQAANSGHAGGEDACRDLTGYDIGSVIEVTGTLSCFRGTRQLDPRRISLLRSTSDEVKAWAETCRFHASVLSKPWFLTEAAQARLLDEANGALLREREDERRVAERRRKREEKTQRKRDRGKRDKREEVLGKRRREPEREDRGREVSPQRKRDKERKMEREREEEEREREKEKEEKEKMVKARERRRLREREVLAKRRREMEARARKTAPLPHSAPEEEEKEEKGKRGETEDKDDQEGKSAQEGEERTKRAHRPEQTPEEKRPRRQKRKRRKQGPCQAANTEPEIVPEPEEAPSPPRRTYPLPRQPRRPLSRHHDHDPWEARQVSRTSRRALPLPSIGRRSGAQEDMFDALGL
ncbi:MAG: hypothetical protein M1819_005622 [Sarea resinae]|nr:MAG: hypothetical protein M1819_005622 [Sarea resinae]